MDTDILQDLWGKDAPEAAFEPKAPAQRETDQLEEIWGPDPASPAEKAQEAVSGFVGNLAGIPAAMADSAAIASEQLSDWDRFDGKTKPHLARRFSQKMREVAGAVAPPTMHPDLQGSLLYQDLPQALGSSVGFLVAGGLGQAARIPAAVSIAASGGAVQASASWHEARLSGASDEDALQAYLLAWGVGASEAIPLAGMLQRANKRSGGILVPMLTEASEEWAQEAFQTTAGNLIAQSLYDEDRDAFEGMVRAGETGFLSGLLLSALVSGSSRIRTPETGEAGRVGGDGREEAGPEVADVQGVLPEVPGAMQRPGIRGDDVREADGGGQLGAEPVPPVPTRGEGEAVGAGPGVAGDRPGDPQGESDTARIATGAAPTEGGVEPGAKRSGVLWGWNRTNPPGWRPIGLVEGSGEGLRQKAKRFSATKVLPYGELPTRDNQETDARWDEWSRKNPEPGERPELDAAPSRAVGPKTLAPEVQAAAAEKLAQEEIDFQAREIESRAQFRERRISELDDDIRKALDDLKHGITGPDGTVKFFAGTPDTETVLRLAKVGALYAQKGYYSFEGFAADLVFKLGEGVRPHLKKAWQEARAQSLPEVQAKMTSQEVVEAVDVDVAFPIREEDAVRIQELEQQALAEGEQTKIGEEPYGRTKLSEDDATRAKMRALDEWRKENDRPIVIAIKDQEARAEAALKKDYSGEEARLRQKMARKEILSPWEMKAASRIVVNKMSGKAIQDGDVDAYLDAMIFADLLRDSRGEAARALGVLRDPLSTARDNFVEAISEPGAGSKSKLKKLKKRREATENPTQRELIDKQIESTLRKEGKKVARVRRELHKVGIRPQDVTHELFMDPDKWAIVARIVSTHKSDGWEKFLEYRLSAMLSGVMTQKANAVGNSANIVLQQHVARFARSLVNLVVKDPNSPTFAEGAAFYRNYLNAMADAGRNFMLAYKRETPVYEMDLLRRGVPLKELGVKIDALSGPAIAGVKGRIIRAPSLTTLLAFDEFAKTLVGQSEAHAFAFRQAKNEGVTGDAIGKRMEEILADPESSVWLDSHNEALEAVFQKRDGITNVALRVRQWIDELTPIPILGRINIPFITTPMNLFRLGLRWAFAPQKLALKGVLGRYKGDPTSFVRDAGDALVGSALSLAILKMVWDEDEDGLPLITGSGGQYERSKSGFQYRTVPPYSIRIGDSYHDYGRLEPMAITIGTLVDLADEIKLSAESDNPEVTQGLFGRFMGSIVDQSKDKTFLRNWADIYKMVFEQDRNKKLTPKLVRDNLVTVMVPNIIRQTARELDPYIRANQTRPYDDSGIWEATMKASKYQSFPAAMNAPPIRYDLWGRPAKRYDPGSPAASHLLYKIFHPVPKRHVEVADLDLLILRYNERWEAGELGEDAERFYGNVPNYWYEKDGKTRYWSDEDYAYLQREAGTRAAERLMERDLNWLEPGERDKKILADQLTKARAEVRKELLAQRE